MFKLSVLACLLVGTQAIVIRLGGCPQTNSQRFFNQFFMKGTWYEIKRYFFLDEGFSRCNTWEWTNNADRSVDIQFESISRSGEKLGQTFTFETDSNDRAILDFDNGLFRQVKFQVISTDYIDYAIVYSCEEIPLLGANVQSAWLLSRDPTGFSSFDTRRIQSTLSDNGIDDSIFLDVNQSDCPE